MTGIVEFIGYFTIFEWLKPIFNIIASIVKQRPKTTTDAATQTMDDAERIPEEAQEQEHQDFLSDFSEKYEINPTTSDLDLYYENYD